MLYDKETGTLWFPENNGLLGIQGVYLQDGLPQLKSSAVGFHMGKKQSRDPVDEINITQDQKLLMHMPSAPPCPCSEIR